MNLVILTAHRIEQLGENPSCSNLKCGRVLVAGEKVYRADRRRQKYYFCRGCEESDETVIYILKNYGGRPRRREYSPVNTRRTTTGIPVVTTDISEEETKEVSESDREIIRDELCSIADRLRKAYSMTVPEIRSFLHEMVDVSI